MVQTQVHEGVVKSYKKSQDGLFTRESSLSYFGQKLQLNWWLLWDQMAVQLGRVLELLAPETL